MALKRALTIKNILDAKVERFAFTGEWYEAFGEPQSTGIWFIFGGSGSGKTSFIMMLIKYLASFCRVLFVSYEEGTVSGSLQEIIKRLGLLEQQNRVLVSVDTLDELELRLSRSRSAKAVIIDSLEHSEFKSIQQIKELAERFPQKLFILIGQAEGDRPRTELGRSVLFLANQKIYVEGYRAFTRGRSHGTPGAYFTIWGEAGDEYWEYK